MSSWGENDDLTRRRKNPRHNPAAQLAKRKLRQRIPELSEALERHHTNEHHRRLIGQSVEHAVLPDHQMEQLEKRIKQKLERLREEQRELPQPIPGVIQGNPGNDRGSILAEIGPDMACFENSKNLCRWRGNCPGNKRPAGK